MLMHTSSNCNAPIVDKYDRSHDKDLYQGTVSLCCVAKAHICICSVSNSVVAARVPNVLCINLPIAVTKDIF